VNPASKTQSTSRNGKASGHCAPVSTPDGNDDHRSISSPVVLFDGACSLCRREIAHYRRVDHASRVTWVDLSDFGPGRVVCGIAYEDAMAVFHVRDTQGNWHRGAFGFVELWHHLGGYRWLGRFIRSLRLTPLLDRAYLHFARWRLRRKCDDASCAAPSNHNRNTGQAQGYTGNSGHLGDSRCE